jgi:Fuc2NAc and GlcNAc transferase
MSPLDLIFGQVRMLAERDASIVMVMLVGLAALALSWTLTGIVRRYALAASLLDLPNARSSHSMPTPRGGGLAIVVSFVLLTFAMGIAGLIRPQVGVVVISGALLVALMGFIDDRKSVSARWRFLAHSFAAGWVVWLMDGIPSVPLFGTSFDLGWAGLALAGLYLVWMTNLYNFMDGIDGIAGIEAITVSLGGALCWWLATGTTQWPLVLVFAACVAGFLIWNSPPAKIFMGDVGSSFIGMVIGALSLWTAQQHTQVFWCWFILTGCFMVDATTTLVRRVRRGEKFHEAHRCHAYQYASRVHGSHQRVSLAVGTINLLWLLPLALAVAMRWIDGAFATLIAYAPLLWLAFRYKAGDRVAQAA